jgi:hypothetical protein
LIVFDFLVALVGKGVGIIRNLGLVLAVVLVFRDGVEVYALAAGIDGVIVLEVTGFPLGARGLPRTESRLEKR